MKNFLVTITIFAIIIFCGVHFGNNALQQAAFKVSRHIVKTSKHQGGQVRELDFKKVHISSPRTVSVRGLSTIIRPRIGPVSRLEYRGVVQALHFTLIDLTLSKVKVSLEKSALELLGAHTQESSKSYLL